MCVATLRRQGFKSAQPTHADYSRKLLAQTTRVAYSRSLLAQTTRANYSRSLLTQPTRANYSRKLLTQTTRAADRQCFLAALPQSKDKRRQGCLSPSVPVSAGSLPCLVKAGSSVVMTRGREAPVFLVVAIAPGSCRQAGPEDVRCDPSPARLQVRAAYSRRLLTQTTRAAGSAVLFAALPQSIGA